MTPSKEKKSVPRKLGTKKKPPQKSCDACRDRILEAAQKLFCENGFTNTSTRAIAAAATCNISLIPYYFGSKEGLLEAVGINVAEKVSRELDLLQKLDIPPEQQLEHFLEFITNHIQKNKGFVLLLLKSFLAEGRSPPQKLQQQIQKNINSAVQLFTKLQTEATVKKDLPPQLAATALMSMVIFHNVISPLLNEITKQSKPASAASINSTIKSIFLHGILNKAPRGGKC
jgi:AcrR family transcriptional regulator